MKDKTLDAYVDGRKKFLEIKAKLAENPLYIVGSKKTTHISGIRQQLEDGLHKPDKEIKVRYLHYDMPPEVPGVPLTHDQKYASYLKTEMFTKK